MEGNNNAAKYAFFYLLSLVSLIFVSTSVGIIIFQIINKYIPDVINTYSGNFSSDALKYAISSLLIAAPIFYLLMVIIYKSLYKGVLDKDSAVRRWLTYFVLLVTSIVMIGWLISIVNSFLDGELTLKFGLKALTAIIISAIIFSFFLYDAKREEVVGKKNNIIRLYFYGSLVIVLASFIFSLFVVESPKETRLRKIDQEVINDFSKINSAVNMYYNEYGKLPDSAEVAKEDSGYLLDNDLKHPVTGKVYEYKKIDEKKYELCADFNLSNKDTEEYRGQYYEDVWRHDAGYQCISQKIYDPKAIEEPKIIE